mmetsp:Transcript_38667/g.76109  ORF Transcript_38667/g.76109 Transcript_38667/m.76109 type:complete len:227 (-) Transcript_38667:152-832(-)
MLHPLQHLLSFFQLLLFGVAVDQNSVRYCVCGDAGILHLLHHFHSFVQLLLLGVAVHKCVVCVCRDFDVVVKTVQNLLGFVKVLLLHVAVHQVGVCLLGTRDANRFHPLKHSFGFVELLLFQIPNDECVVRDSVCMHAGLFHALQHLLRFGEFLLLHVLHNGSVVRSLQRVPVDVICTDSELLQLFTDLLRYLSICFQVGIGRVFVHRVQNRELKVGCWRCWRCSS